ncbi:MULTISPECIES: hypothetical protein [unclassified Microcoleus]
MRLGSAVVVVARVYYLVTGIGGFFFNLVEMARSPDKSFTKTLIN